MSRSQNLIATIITLIGLGIWITPTTHATTSVSAEILYTTKNMGGKIFPHYKIESPGAGGTLRVHHQTDTYNFDIGVHSLHTYYYTSEQTKPWPNSIRGHTTPFIAARKELMRTQNVDIKSHLHLGIGYKYMHITSARDLLYNDMHEALLLANYTVETDQVHSEGLQGNAYAFFGLKTPTEIQTPATATFIGIGVSGDTSIDRKKVWWLHIDLHIATILPTKRKTVTTERVALIMRPNNWLKIEAGLDAQQEYPKGTIGNTVRWNIKTAWIF